MNKNVLKTVGVVGLLIFSQSASAAGAMLYDAEVTNRTWDLSGLVVCGDESKPARGLEAAVAVATDPKGRGKQYLKDNTCWVFRGHCPAIFDGHVEVETGPDGQVAIFRGIIVDTTGYVLVPHNLLAS